MLLLISLTCKIRFIWLCLSATILFKINMKTNLLDNEAAKAAAKRIYQKINFSGGALQSYEISTLLTDTYEYLKIPFKPTSRDIKTYTDILDINKDGQVTLSDLENLAVTYLCGPGVLTNQPFDPSIKKQKFEVTGLSGNIYSPSFSSNNYSNYQLPSNEYNFASIKQQNINFGASSMQGNAVEAENNQQGDYNQQALALLAITRQIFENYADENFTIIIEAVPDLLGQTYEALGRKGYRPNTQDVRVWMKLCDGNGDGHVEYEQYEYFVVRSLQRSGFQVYR